MFNASMIAATYVLVVSGSFFLLASLTSPSRYLSSPGMIKIVSIKVFFLIPLMKWRTIFDMMFLLDTTFPSSTLSLLGDFFIPLLDADAIEMIPLNVVNMLQKIVETTHVGVKRMNNNFNNIQIEDKFLKGAKIVPLQSIHPSFEDCDDNFVSKEGLNESKEEEGYNLLWVLPTKNIKYEDLSDHGMNQVLDCEAPM